MAFGSSARVQELEQENAWLRQVVSHLQGTDLVTISSELKDLLIQKSQAVQELTHLQTEFVKINQRLVHEEQQMVEVRETAMLQEVGIYDYKHPVESAVMYKQRLDECRQIMKQLVKYDHAVSAAPNWHLNNSLKKGQKMVRELKKLMLRAYNAEADNIVRTLKPYARNKAIERLSKSRETIARLGASMEIRVSDSYHAQRIYEIELTADYLAKAAAERERIREERARQREDEKAKKEFEAEIAKRRKEEAHYKAAYTKALASKDAAAIETLKQKLADISESIEKVEARAANTRAGYVYVISNRGAFGEHMVKIGMTRRLEPTDRIRELGDASVPFKFDTHALIFSDDAVGLETKLHQKLTDKRVNRVNNRREFFYATPVDVRELLTKIAGSDLLVEYNEVAEALEWRASGAHLTNTQLPVDTPDPELVPESETVGPLDDITNPEPVEQKATPSKKISRKQEAAEDLSSSRPTAAPPVARKAVPASAEPIAVNEAVPPPSELEPESAQVALPSVEHSERLPGWHPDPWFVTRLRWWDGQQWTSHTAH